MFQDAFNTPDFGSEGLVDGIQLFTVASQAVTGQFLMAEWGVIDRLMVRVGVRVGNRFVQTKALQFLLCCVQFLEGGYTVHVSPLLGLGESGQSGRLG